jgi:hypothetical protein
LRKNRETGGKVSDKEKKNEGLERKREMRMLGDRGLKQDK